MSAQPGWYPDPGGVPVLRWWDGYTWTSQTMARPAPPTTKRSTGWLIPVIVFVVLPLVLLIIFVMALVVGISVDSRSA